MLWQQKLDKEFKVCSDPYSIEQNYHFPLSQHYSSVATAQGCINFSIGKHTAGSWLMYGLPRCPDPSNKCICIFLPKCSTLHFSTLNGSLFIYLSNLDGVMAQQLRQWTCQLENRQSEFETQVPCNGVNACLCLPPAHLAV